MWPREVIKTATWLRGYFPLIRNDLSLTKALSAYNQPYHLGLRFTWLKGAGLLAPYTEDDMLHPGLCLGGGTGAAAVGADLA